MTMNEIGRTEATTTVKEMHERYVRAINSALRDGREAIAYELAVSYSDDLHEQRKAA